MSPWKGFTLLELLITLAIIAVLLGLSAPPLRAMIQKQDGEVALRTLAEHLALARSTAVSNAVVVTFCRSADGMSCSGTWSSGSIVFTDRNADRLLNQDDQLLRSTLRDPVQGTIYWKAFQNRQFLQIDTLGFLRHQSGNFTYCPLNGDARFARQLIVNNTGRARLALDTDGDGLREDSHGAALRCQ